MKRVKIEQTEHEFSKQNLVGIQGRRGIYDVLKCKNCGIQGKSYKLGTIEFVKSFPESKLYKCKAIKHKKPVKIKITECLAMGALFANITPGSIHDVVNAPAGEPDNLLGVWVMGVGKPVKILSGEFEVLE